MTRRDAKELLPCVIVAHGQTRCIIEIVHIEQEGTILTNVNQLVVYFGFPGQHPFTARSPVRSKSHQLVFAAVDLETTVISKSGVEKTERMGEIKLFQNFNLAVLPKPDCRRRPFTDTVQSQDRGLIKRRREKGTASVRQVVFRKDKRWAIAANGLKLLLEVVSCEQFFLDPNRDTGQEAFQPPRREAVICLKQPFEFDIRLVVEDNGINIRELQPGLIKNVVDGMNGKTRVLFFSGKSLFMRSGNNIAIDNQCSSTVMIISRNPQNGFRHNRHLE